MKKYVWEFTNQRKLTSQEFVDYFERKIFRTIRKYSMLPEDKKIILEDSKTLNENVLEYILKKKFSVEKSNKPNLNSFNLSGFAEETLQCILAGDFSNIKKSKSPLCLLSDKEIELYASIKNIRGERRKVNKKIRKLLSKFIEKNQDLELNVLKAIGQINE